MPEYDYFLPKRKKSSELSMYELPSKTHHPNQTTLELYQALHEMKNQLDKTEDIGKLYEPKTNSYTEPQLEKFIEKHRNPHRVMFLILRCPYDEDPELNKNHKRKNELYFEPIPYEAVEAIQRNDVNTLSNIVAYPDRTIKNLSESLIEIENIQSNTEQLPKGLWGKNWTPEEIRAYGKVVF